VDYGVTNQTPFKHKYVGLAAEHDQCGAHSCSINVAIVLFISFSSIHWPWVTKRYHITVAMARVYLCPHQLHTMSRWNHSCINAASCPRK